MRCTCQTNLGSVCKSKAGFGWESTGRVCFGKRKDFGDIGDTDVFGHFCIFCRIGKLELLAMKS